MTSASKKYNDDERQPSLPFGESEVDRQPALDLTWDDNKQEEEEKSAPQHAPERSRKEEELSDLADSLLSGRQDEKQKKQPSPRKEKKAKAPKKQVMEELLQEEAFDDDDDNGNDDGSVGSRLRAARRAKGYSIEDIADQTKLGKAFIQYMETGNYSDLPAKVYCESFLRQLCKIYALDFPELLKLMRQEMEELDATRDVFDYTKRQLGGDEAKSSFLSIGRLVNTVLILVVILMFATVVLFLAKRRDGKPVDLGHAKTRALLEEGVELPEVDLKKFILPEELPLDELEIPGS